MMPRLFHVMAAGLVVAMLVTGCATDHPRPVNPEKVQAALAKSDHLIVYGQRVGPVRLGMGWDEVIDLLGEPDWQHIKTGNNPTEAPTQMRYSALNMKIFFTESATPVVSAINLSADQKTDESKRFGDLVWSDFSPAFAADFRTSDGVGLGSSSFEVARAWGDYRSSSPVEMRYPNRGIMLTVTKDHKIWMIGISNVGAFDY